MSSRLPVLIIADNRNAHHRFIKKEMGFDDENNEVTNPSSKKFSKIEPVSNCSELTKLLTDLHGRGDRDFTIMTGLNLPGIRSLGSLLRTIDNFIREHPKSRINIGLCYSHLKGLESLYPKGPSTYLGPYQAYQFNHSNTPGSILELAKGSDLAAKLEKQNTRAALESLAKAELLKMPILDAEPPSPENQRAFVKAITSFAE